MEAAARKAVGTGGIARDAHATMAIGAKTLQVVAADAARVVLARRLGVQGDPIVGMHVARTNSAIVAIVAPFAGVATGTELAVGSCNALVACQPVWRVGGTMEPLRRLQRPGRELGLHLAVGLRQMAVGAVALGFAPRSSAHRMAGKAAGHAGELFAGRKLQILDVPVTLCALNVAVEVGLVVHAQVRSWIDHLGDLASFAWIFTQVAKAALSRDVAVWVGDLCQIGVVRVVAVVAGFCGVRQKPVITLHALVGGRVARLAALLEDLDVFFVVEADGDALRRKDAVAGQRAGVRAGRHPFQGHHAPAMKRGTSMGHVFGLGGWLSGCRGGGLG